MSIHLITCAFKARMKPMQKLVFLALCDSANDQGECFPSVSMLMEKCSASERTIQETVASLARDGYLSRDIRAGRSTIYSITDPRKWRTPAESAPPQNLHHTPANGAPSPPQTAHPTPANGAPITVREPLIQKKEARERASAPKVERPEGVSEQVWCDWLQLRKTKRAPVTQTVLKDAYSEANKAGMTLEAFFIEWCARGSQGLRAEWLQKNGKTAQAKGATWERYYPDEKSFESSSN